MDNSPRTRFDCWVRAARTFLDVPFAWPGTASDNMTNRAQLQEVIDRANAEKAHLKK